MIALRWLLLIPATIAGWYAIFAAALFTHFYVEQYFCPPEDLVSGFCHNAKIQWMLAGLIHVSVGLSSITVIGIATMVAPSHKKQTTRVILAVGIVVAAYFGFVAHSWSLFLAAAIGGILGVFCHHYFDIAFIENLPSENKS